jgi:UDP-N-acetylmuramoyl-L-alanyl-D-glutamate--2,6-diaminopimelate ligase
MSNLPAIVFQYTNTCIPFAKHIIDNTLDIVETSLLILRPPHYIAAEIYTQRIINHLSNQPVVATIFLDGAEEYFKDHSKFGVVIISCWEVAEKIIQEYYCLTPRKILGVTGTYGKTSTSIFLYELLKNMQVKTSLVGSLGIRGIDHKYLKINRNTTPSWITLKRILHISALNNIEVTILEVSSQGIAEGRIRDIKFDGGIWTGFAVDHLEFHKNLEDYFSTKESFMKNIPITIVCQEVYKYFDVKFTPTYIYSREINSITDEGFTFNNKEYKQKFNVKFFQQDNMLAALLLLHYMGYENVFSYNNLICQVPSRMEYFGTTNNGAAIYSDNSYRLVNIQKILDYFTSYNLKRVILVIGAGGDRNRGADYRKNIGELSKRVQQVIVTDDNPRSEDPMKIRGEIIDLNNNIFNIGERFNALITAFCIAKPENIIVILSHGSDEKIIYKKHYVLMSDREIFEHYQFHYCMKFK